MRPCYGLLDDRGLINSSAQSFAPPLMTENQCEAERRHELTIELLEIPQDREKPMSLSIGAKDNVHGGSALACIELTCQH